MRQSQVEFIKIPLLIRNAFLHQESHSESDADAAGLDVESVDGHSLITSLGAILGYRIDRQEMAFLPEIWANWRHEFLDQGDHIDASFLGTPGSSFTTALDKPYRDRANLGAGITMLISERASTFLKYNGMFQTRGDYHNFSLGVMIQFQGAIFGGDDLLRLFKDGATDRSSLRAFADIPDNGFVLALSVIHAISQRGGIMLSLPTISLDLLLHRLLKSGKINTIGFFHTGDIFI